MKMMLMLMMMIKMMILDLFQCSYNNNMMGRVNLSIKIKKLLKWVYVSKK